MQYLFDSIFLSNRHRNSIRGTYFITAIVKLKFLVNDLAVILIWKHRISFLSFHFQMFCSRNQIL